MEEELADQYFLCFLRENIDEYFVDRFLRRFENRCYFTEKWKYIREIIHSYLNTVSLENLDG